MAYRGQAEIFEKHKQNPYEKRVDQFMRKSFRGFPFDRFKTHVKYAHNLQGPNRDFQKTWAKPV